MDRLGRIDMLVELLRKEPNDLFLNYALGLEYVAELSVKEAEAQFRKSLEINPDHIPSYYQLGKLFESQLKNSEALAFFKEGLEKAKQQKNNKAINEFGEAIFMLED
jgi:tetratricopeptide (TPR) repeat protein